MNILKINPVFCFVFIFLFYSSEIKQKYGFIQH